VANVTDERNDERTDEELLAAIAAGPGALPEFYRRHVGRIVAAGARRYREPADVADFTAAVFLRVIESAVRYDPRRGKAVAWLYGIANNVAAEERRRRAQAARAELRISGRDLLADDDIERLERRIDAESDARAVHEALERLPEGDQALLELIAVDGLSPAEAAGVLGISRVAVRVRLHRSRGRLRALIGNSNAATGSGQLRVRRTPARETER
jgi:RNA polymerase sigma factor (sigma-70 family)